MRVHVSSLARDGGDGLVVCRVCCGPKGPRFNSWPLLKNLEKLPFGVSALRKKEWRIKN